MWNPLKLFRKPPMMEHRPAPEPRRRAARPAVTTTQTHKTLEINIFNWHRSGGTARPARQGSGRSLLDLRVLDRFFGARPAAPPSVARVRAANRRRDAAQERIAARQQVKRQPAPASRPATRADYAELRRLQRERAAHEAQQQRQQQAAAQQAPTVVEGEVVEDKPVHVRRHTREGKLVKAHERAAPGEGEE